MLLHEYAHVVRGHLAYRRQYSRLDAALNEAPARSAPVEAGLRRFYELDADVVAAYRAAGWLIPPASPSDSPVEQRAVHLLFSLGVVMLALDTRRSPLERPLAWPSPHPVVRMMLVQGVFGSALYQRFGVPKEKSLGLAGDAMELIARYAAAIGRSGRPWQRRGAGRRVTALVGRERRRWVKYATVLFGSDDVSARIRLV